MAMVVTMRRKRGGLVLPVAVIMAVVLFLAVLGGGAEARPLSGGDGGGWAVTGDAPLPTTGGVFIVETLRRLYLQQLGAGPSCQTNSPNNGCPPP
ncbi:hypothetical protein SORBI_3010G102500 [Sorghum bicolor]|uniref:Uncharacterized protein n=1 Tax=Sorghum bicolor TaxID=4558 RepID=C5Z7W5_SORBI|nr:hypothetical protein SORBI_3010G102500 [Sorghum bicolor]